MSQSRMSQCRRTGSFGGGVCEQDAEMYESWRCSPRSSMRLGEAGLDQLFTYLNQTFYVTPRRSCQIQGDFPVLTITPIELFRHMLARFEGERWSNDNDDRAERPAFFEIFGGAALAVCHADRCEEAHGSAIRRPTDLDARFYISNHCFDSCRAKVEDYLHLKLIQTISSDRQQLDNLIAPSMIRFVYFQKQAVVGDAFSLLSIGDSDTGLNIDLEFAHLGNGVRKYFDEGNAGVIPLTLEQLSGYGSVYALSQTGDVGAMLDLHFRKELVVQSPEEVVNGLALYVHAMCDKGMTPADRETEDYYGQSFCEAFLTQSKQLVDSGHGPLRFVHSFMRSHFALRPTLAAAAVAQMLVELSTYQEGLWEVDLGGEMLSQLVLLFCESIVHSFNVNTPADATAALCWLIDFLASPMQAEGTDGEEHGSTGPAERIRVLQPCGEAAGGRGALCQVVSKERCGSTRVVCAQVLLHLRRTASRVPPAWHAPVLHAACSAMDAAESCRGARGWSGLVCEVLRRVTDDAAQPQLAADMLLGGLAARMHPEALHAAAAHLLPLAPAASCKPLVLLLVSARPPQEQPTAARAAVRVLQARKYACPRCVGCHNNKARVGKGEAGGACGECGGADRAIRRLLFDIIPAAASPPLPHPKLCIQRSPSPPAPPPGPNTPTAPHNAQGPPQPGERSPSPEEPRGNRSPSPEFLLPLPPLAPLACPLAAVLPERAAEEAPPRHGKCRNRGRDAR